MEIPALVVTGPVGAGKTSVATAISGLLDEAGIAHALVDMDALRGCSPAPVDDPFHIQLGLRNLAAVWTNYRDAGARRLILADVVESRAEVAGYRAAVPGARVVVVRLRAPVPVLVRRLEGRETGASLDWHCRRAAELAEQMEASAVEDILVDTEGVSIGAIAAEILSRWSEAARLSGGAGE